MQKLVVGIDLGGTKMAGALVDSEGNLVGPILKVPTPAHDGRAAMLDAIAELAGKVIAAGTTNTGAWTIAGVGIGTAGVVDVTSGSIVASTDAISEWAGTQVREGVGQLLKEAGYNVPIHVENDVDAHAGGEAWLGAGRGARCAIVVAVGTGVGGAVVIDGQTWRGTHHLAGDLGHFPAVGAQGEPCTCGRFGHLEAVSAGPQIYRRYLALGGDAQVSGTRELETRAEAGDELAAQVYRDSAQALANVLVGLAYTLDPDCIIISGGLANAGKCWWGPLQETFKAQLSGPLENLELVSAQLGSTAPIVGAARGAWQLIN